MALKPINPMAFIRMAQNEEPKLYLWIRAKGHIGKEEQTLIEYKT